MPPRPVPLKTAVILSTALWVVGLVLYVGIAEVTLRVPITSVPLRLLALAGFGVVAGALTGWMDWRWNRTPYYSQFKKRWFNQTGYLFLVGGVMAGVVAGGLGWVEIRVVGYEGLSGGGVAGAIYGVVLGVIYRLTVFIFRLGKPWEPNGK